MRLLLGSLAVAFVEERVFCGGPSPLSSYIHADYLIRFDAVCSSEMYKGVKKEFLVHCMNDLPPVSQSDGTANTGNRSLNIHGEV